MNELINQLKQLATLFSQVSDPLVCPLQLNMAKIVLYTQSRYVKPCPFPIYAMKTF